MQKNFQCLVDSLDAVGYRVQFMGGYRKTRIAGTNIWSKHASGNALDVNQTGRNRVTQRLPSNATAMARACGLFHGAQWAHADAGHFETTGGRLPWPRAVEPQRDLARVIPLPRSRPILASDFAELDIVPAHTSFNLARLDTEAMPVAHTLAVADVELEQVPVALPPQNIFEAFADKFLQPIPVGNCREWDKIKPGVKRIVSDATRHFSRKYGLTLIAEANSCYRDPVHNKRVGGARLSAHLNHTALDFKITAPDHSWAVPAEELFAFCKSHKLARGCGVYRYKHIIHADVNPVRRPGLTTWDKRWGAPTRLAKLKKNKRKYAKRWSKKRWAAFKKKQHKKKLAQTKRRYASR